MIIEYCVNRNFYRPPSDATSGDARRCEPAYVLAEDFSLVDTVEDGIRELCGRKSATY